MTPETLEAAILNPDYLIQIATALKEEREKRKLLETENAQQKQIIGELKPRADYTDRILSNKGLVTITQIAKDYGMSGRKMNKLLEDLHVQYKQSGQWLLYGMPTITTKATLILRQSTLHARTAHPMSLWKQSGRRKADCLFMICLRVRIFSQQ